MTNYTDTDKHPKMRARIQILRLGHGKKLVILVRKEHFGCWSDKYLAESGEYNDLADAGADREGAGAQKCLAFGGADMDLAHAGANKNLA